MFFSALVLLSALVASAQGAPLARTTVQAASGRSCAAYLQARPDAIALPLVVSLHGSGVYTNADDLTPAADAVAAGRVAVLTIDKPGIAPDPQAPGGVRVDDAVYNDYTRADLVDCVVAALAWTRAQPVVSPEGSLVVFGHSEGALVALALLDRLYASAPDQAARVRGLLLSGTPVEDFRATLVGQVGAGRARTWEARARAGDDATLRSAVDMGADTLVDLFDAAAFEELLAGLASRGARTPITLFHGEDDRACDPTAVRDSFEARWERRHPADRRPLRIQLRRYPDAGHSGNAELAADLALHAEVALLGVGPYGEPADAEGVVDLPVPLDARARLEGTYGGRREAIPQISVVARGDQLVAQPAGQPLITLLHQGGLVFVADLDPSIVVRFDAEGRFVLEQGGGTFPLSRVGPPDRDLRARVAGPAPVVAR